MINDKTSEALGNPLKENDNIEALRKAHGAHMSCYGPVTLRDRPITAIRVCSYAKLFWFVSTQLHKETSSSSRREVQLHPILCIGMNFGLRYDELSRLTMDYFSADLGESTMTINEKMKKNHGTENLQT